MKTLIILLLAALGQISNLALAADDPPPPQTLFKNVNIFNGTEDKLYENHQVLVEGNIIKAISAGEIEARDGATVIDGNGRTLMPGLIDSHVHLNLTGLFFSFDQAEFARWDAVGAMAAANARDYLMDGYTTVRELVGPRIYPSGACIGPTSGHGDWRSPRSRALGGPKSTVEILGFVEIADGPDEIRAATRRNLSNGASQIKLMSGGGVSSKLDPLWSKAYSVEEMKAAVDAAAFFDTYVLVHAYTDETISNALDAGAKVIDHGQMITEASMQKLVEKGAFLSLNTAGFSPILFEHPNFAPGTPSGKKLAVAHEGSRNLVELVKKYKPKVVHNVDTVLSTFAQGRAHRDFEKFQFADWFGNFAMLVSATSAGGELAQLTGKRNPYPGRLGVIEKGAYADILIVEGNPLEDLSVLGASPRWFDAEPRGEGHAGLMLIMKDGKIFKNTLGASPSGRISPLALGV
jgi:imidazolonepropionase-like amidohydrolase